MKNLTKIMVSLVVFIFFCNLFLFQTPSAFSVGLFLFGLSIFTLAVTQYKHTSTWVLVATNIFALIILIMRAAHFIQFATLCTLLFVSSLIWYLNISREKLFGSFTGVFLSPFYAFLSYVKRLFVLIKPSTVTTGYRRFVFLFSNDKNHSTHISTLIGIVIAFPIGLVLLAMFAAADPIYYSYLKQIISRDLIEELPWRIILSFIISLIIIPLFFPKIQRIFFSPGQVLGRIHMKRELTVVMIAVALIIFSFIAIQWQYVFVNVKAETDLSQFGVKTYAEYVTKGFIELLRVSAFIYALLWLGLSALRQKFTNKRQLLYILQWIIMSEFIVILISVFRRIYLYQLYHGLTLIRIYGAFFIVWITCMTITLALRHITNKLRFGMIEGIISIVLFMILGVWNVEKYIVINHPPTVNKRIDYVYLSRMSADGVDGWLQAYSHAKQVVEAHFGQKAEIDSNNRREIAYAEFILRRMTYLYYDYMNKFATPQEMRQYVTTIIDFQNSRLEKEKKELQDYQAVKHDETWVKDRIIEINKIQDGLKKVKNQPLSDSPKTDGEVANQVDITVDYVSNFTVFEPVFAPMLLSFYNSYTNMSGQNYTRQSNNLVTRYVKTSKLDHLYQTNTSDLQAFQKMKLMIPLSELHLLQEKFYTLESQIRKQESRDFDHDISLDSPLL